MSEILGTFHAGQVRLDEPVNWPDGARVRVQPVVVEDLPVGMTEDEQTGSPERITAWLARFDALEPLGMTPAEEADETTFRAEVRRGRELADE
jgi:hypothetical protein